MPELSVVDGLSRTGVLHLDCPRCGLTITPRARWLVVEHCPRCIAHAGTAVKMSLSVFGTPQRYTAHWSPRAEALR